MSDKQVVNETDEMGIPLKSAFPEKPPVALLIIVVNTIPTIIGLVIAHFLVNATADAAIDILSSYELGWLYLGIFLLKLFQIPQTILLGTTRKACKVNPPDQHVYKVMGTNGLAEQLGYVLMENQGDIGRFNRAQRAFMNYHEAFPTVALLYVAAGFVFPLASFITMVVFSLARVVSAVGYVKSENSRNNTLVPTLLAVSILHGMVGIAAYQALSS